MVSSIKYTLDFEKPLIALQEQLGQLEKLSRENGVSMDNEIAAIELRIKETKEHI